MPLDYSFPQVTDPLVKGERGLASITHGGRTFRFRTNPNDFDWTYTINKRIDQTYGGRVVQLLGTKIDDFTLTAEAGNGGWPYIQKMAYFMRDIMVDQRNGVPAIFEYTTRGWRLNCYIVSVPFQDEIQAVAREFEIQMKVQEDVTGLLSRGTLRAELARLQNGVEFTRNQYNDPLLGQQVSDQEDGIAAQALANTMNAIKEATDVLGYASDNWLPNGVGGSFPGGNTFPGSMGIPGLGIPGIGAS